jgi:hypothetical protein
MFDPEAMIIVIPVVLAMALGYGAVKGCQEWVDPQPAPPCKDFTYSMSAFRSDVASCPTGMEMELDTRILGKDLVHCYCPTAVEIEEVTE